MKKMAACRAARRGTAILLLLLAGCRFLGRTPEVTLVDDPQQGKVSMPEVVHSDVDRTGRRLADAGLVVTVRRPAASYQRQGKAPVVLPEIARPFRPAQWNHLIAAQEPAAGTVLPPGSTVTLTAGMHHGAGPFGAWLGTHRYSVAARGESRCRDCHLQRYCSDCHAGVR